MNTFEARNINDVPEHDREFVKEFCREALENNLDVTIRLDGDSIGDTFYTHLYGVYAKTRDEVIEYYRSGGTWDYRSPRCFI